MINLFTIYILILASAVCARGAIITGPVTNSVNGHLYYLLAQTNWAASEQEALEMGGHLVTINDAAEQLWVYSTFSAWGGVNRALLIGLNDHQNEGSFQWANGEPVPFTNWNPGEPNDGNAIHLENVVHMYAPNQTAPGKWNDFAESETSAGVGPSFAPIHGVVEIDPLHVQVSLPTIRAALNSAEVTPLQLRSLATEVQQATRALQRLKTKVQKRIAPGDPALAAQIQTDINQLLAAPSE